MGTANALAHVLFGFSTKLIPISIACDVIIGGKIAQIDTAKCNETLMLLLVGLGFEHKMIAGANREEKDAGGQLAYVQALWLAVSRNEILTLQVQMDDLPAQTIETASLVIANAAPFTTVLAQGGGESDITDGILDVTWIPPQQDMTNSLLSLAELTLSGMSEQVNPAQNNHIKAKKIVVNASHDFEYVIDGEVHYAGCLNVDVMPQSLNILVK